MRPTQIQKAITMGASIGSLLLIIGGLLDTFSNAIEWITPAMTYFGTAICPIIYAVCAFYLRRKGIAWVTNDGQRVYIRRLGLIPVLSLITIMGVLWLPRAYQPGDPRQEFLVRLSELSILQATTAAKQESFQQQLATLNADSRSNQPSVDPTRTAITEQLAQLEATSMALQRLEMTVTAAAAGTRPPEDSHTPTYTLSATQFGQLLATTSPACGEIVAVRDLNIRQGPGLDYESIGTLHRDDRVTVLGQYGFNEGNLYWYIACPATINLVSCWVSGGEEYTIGATPFSCPLVTPISTPMP